MNIFETSFSGVVKETRWVIEYDEREWYVLAKSKDEALEKVKGWVLDEELGE